MKTQNIQNVFKLMIGTSALITSTAFFINTISPVQAKNTNDTVVGDFDPIYVGCGSGIYEHKWTYGRYEWIKVGP